MAAAISSRDPYGSIAHVDSSIVSDQHAMLVFVYDELNMELKNVSETIKEQSSYLGGRDNQEEILGKLKILIPYLLSLYSLIHQLLNNYLLSTTDDSTMKRWETFYTCHQEYTKHFFTLLKGDIM